MSYTPNPGSGAIHPSKFYEKGGRSPYATGTICTEDGAIHEIALWVRRSQRGTTFFSAKVTAVDPPEPDVEIDTDDLLEPPKPTRRKPAVRKQTAKVVEDDEDELPF